MDAMTLKSFVTEHPDGVRIRMVDGTTCDAPHRDSIWVTPAYGKPEQGVGRYATSFWLHDTGTDQARLVNALLVAEVEPLRTNGNGRRRGPSSRDQGRPP